MNVIQSAAKRFNLCRLVKITVIYTVVLSLAISFTACSVFRYPRYFSSNAQEAEKKASQACEIDYAEYVNIVCDPVEVRREKCVVYENASFDNALYNIRVENRTQKPLTFECQIFTDAYFTENFMENSSELICVTSGEIVLDVGKGVTINGDMTFRNRDSLDAESKGKFDETRDVYCFEFRINGKWSYVKYDAKADLQ